MLGSLVPLQSSPPTVALDSVAGASGDLSRPRPGAVCCASRRSHASIPKLEPFSRSRADRLATDPPFLRKCENELTDYSTTLEGDEAYSYWTVKDIEKELPKEDVKTLNDCVHGITAMDKKAKKVVKPQTPVRSSDTQKERPFPIPDGIRKTEEELEEEEKARMPDSPFTRLLRVMGRRPAWYTQPPDHETDCVAPVRRVI